MKPSSSSATPRPLPTLDQLHGFVKLPADMATHAHNLEIAYADALKEIERLKEYEWMYKDLCK